MALVGWTTEAVTRRRWAVQTRLATHFADLVAGLPTLQVFGRAKAQAEGLRRTETAHRSETMRTLRVSFLSALVLELLATLSVAVIAVTVGFRVVFGDLDLATALFVLILAPEAYLPLRQLGVHYHDAADGMAAAEAAFGIIEAAEQPATNSPAPAPSATDGPDVVLRVVDLGHTYPGSSAPALTPISLTVHRGEVVALTGPSGCGKTTLLNAVMGFITPSTGSITLSGRAAWVGQQPGLIAGTVADNVRMGHPGATDTAVGEALTLAGAGNLPLDKPIGDEAEGVSAGERRRIAVARALLRVTLGRARLLVLDEPTAGLDPKERIRIRNFISSVSRDRITLLATHIVSDIESISDQILLMKKGKLLGMGTPEQLLESVADKVKEMPCPAEKLEAVQKQYRVGNVFQRQGETWVRLIGDDLPDEGNFVQDRVSLEDVYLYYLGE